MIRQIDGGEPGEFVKPAHLLEPIERFYQEIKQHLGAEFQGRTWDGFHRHLAVVKRSHTFIAEQRLWEGINGEGLPSFGVVLDRLLRETGIQHLMEMLDLDSDRSTQAAEVMLRGFIDWHIPEI